MSIPALEEKLAQAKRAGRLPKVVMPVHFGGQSCDMPAIGALARRYGFRVVEDASHAIGAEYQGERVGACAHSDIAVFSFHPVKILTTGEGGMLLTNDDVLARRLRLLRSHGITRDDKEMESASEGPWYYQQVVLGYNYRMTDIQAALGESQMHRLDAFLARRRELARRYDGALADLPLVTPFEDPGGRSSWHLYVVQIELEALNWRRRDVFERMRSAGILVNVHYLPVHLQPYYRALGFAAGDFPASERYYESAISLPMYFELTNAQPDRVCNVFRESLH